MHCDAHCLWLFTIYSLEHSLCSQFPSIHFLDHPLFDSVLVKVEDLDMSKPSREILVSKFWNTRFIFDCRSSIKQDPPMVAYASSSISNLNRPCPFSFSSSINKFRWFLVPRWISVKKFRVLCTTNKFALHRKTSPNTFARIWMRLAFGVEWTHCGISPAFSFV